MASSTQSYQRERAFQARTASLDGPQSDALQWAAERQYRAAVDTATPYILLARELGVAHKPHTWRAYTAMQLGYFVDSTCVARKEQQCWCEIVVRDAPCKTYLDLELAPEPKKHGGDRDIAMRALCDQFGVADAAALWIACDAACTRFVTVLVELLSARASRDLSVSLDVERLEAHKPTKWSVHIIVDGSRIGRGCEVRESVLWRTNADCKAFISAVLADKRLANDALVQAIVDRCVYSANRLIRIYGSSKLKEPQRVLQPHGAAHDAPVERCAFMRSLITCVCVQRARFDASMRFFLQPPHASLASSRSHVCVTTQFLALVEPPTLVLLEHAPLRLARSQTGLLMQSAISTVPTTSSAALAARVSAGSSLLHRICAHATFADYRPRLRFKGDRPESVLLSATSAKCEYALNGAHGARKQPAFLLLDLVRAQWQQRCLSDSCERRKPVIHTMPRDLATLCMQYLSREWPSGELMGGIALRRCLPCVTRGNPDSDANAVCT